MKPGNDVALISHGGRSVYTRYGDAQLCRQCRHPAGSPGHTPGCKSGLTQAQGSYSTWQGQLTCAGPRQPLRHPHTQCPAVKTLGIGLLGHLLNFQRKCDGHPRARLETSSPCTTLPHPNCTPSCRIRATLVPRVWSGGGYCEAAPRDPCNCLLG